MKRFIVGVLVGLLLIGAAVLAQGEWQGQQWEYLILQVEDDEVTTIPMIGNALQMGIYNEQLEEAANELADEFSDRRMDFLYPFYLQVLGEHGWELAGDYRATGISIGQIFKRPIP